MPWPNRKRGPLPLNAKRDLYVQLMNQGANNSGACRQVGVNRKTGQRWRLGRVVNPQARRIPPRTDHSDGRRRTSDRYLSDQERLTIADGVRVGRSRHSIAAEPGRSVSTVCLKCRETVSHLASIGRTPRINGC